MHNQEQEILLFFQFYQCSSGSFETFSKVYHIKYHFESFDIIFLTCGPRIVGLVCDTDCKGKFCVDWTEVLFMCCFGDEWINDACAY